MCVRQRERERERDRDRETERERNAIYEFCSLEIGGSPYFVLIYDIMHYIFGLINQKAFTYNRLRSSLACM